MNRKTFYYNSKDSQCPFLLSKRLADMLLKRKASPDNIVILCIGSDRSTGDSLGPLVGYKLSKKSISFSNIYGTLESPVHAVNLKCTLDMIHALHPGCTIIALDACVGRHSHIGYITLSTGPLMPGLGVRKNLPQVGDICITGIVNFQSVMDNTILQSTRLNTVMKLADSISEAVFAALKAVDVLSCS